MPLKEKVSAGKFAVLAEFQPPKGADFTATLPEANLVRGRVDAFVVPDQPVAVMKASALGFCAFLEQHGLPTVMQISPRDRNRIALQGDLLSAAALGVSTILIHHGDDVLHGDHHLAREVRDLDELTLLDALVNLDSGKDMAGIALSKPTNFLTGVEIVTGAGDNLLDSEIERLNTYKQKGIGFIVTSPVFDAKQLAGLLTRLNTADIAVIPQILVLKSAGMARYVDRNVRDISIPSDIVRRVEKAPDRERVGLKIAGEMLARLKEMKLAGAVVLTRGWEKRLPQILDHAAL
jgi:methylenetetrahydrofolate reductase (NADPH)